MNEGIIIQPDGTYHRIDLGTLPTSAIRAQLNSNRLDVAALDSAIDAWTEDVADEELWERRWVTGPTPVVNQLATALAVHMSPHRRWGVLYGTVILASHTVDTETENVWTTGLSNESIEYITSVLRTYARAYGKVIT